MASIARQNSKRAKDLSERLKPPIQLMFKTKGPARAERRLQGSQLSGMGTDENRLMGLFVNVYIPCLYSVHYHTLSIYVFMYVYAYIYTYIYIHIYISKYILTCTNYLCIYIYRPICRYLYITGTERERERDLRRKLWMVPPAASFVSEGEQGFLIFIWPHAEGGDKFWSCYVRKVPENWGYHPKYVKIKWSNWS